VKSSRVRTLVHMGRAFPELTFPLGWDVGIVGMKAGGERELDYPCSHGLRQEEDRLGIPPNSTLKFGQFLLSLPFLRTLVLTHLLILEVKLLSIN
jgi:hypothetical protein